VDVAQNQEARSESMQSYSVSGLYTQQDKQARIFFSERDRASGLVFFGNLLLEIDAEYNHG
jgi:hypothetical protein